MRWPSGRLRRWGSLLAAWLVASSAHAAPPRDPNDTPFMTPPAGQPRRSEARRVRFDGPETKSRHSRLSLDIEPLFASFRAPFIGRPSQPPLRGGGLGIDLGIEVTRGLGVVLIGAYSAHPAQAEFGLNANEERVQSASAGVSNNAFAGLGLRYRMDVGPIESTLGAGLGGMVIVSPNGVQSGQRGQPGIIDGTVCSCDLGLACSQPGDVCTVRPLLAVYIEAGLDIPFRKRLAVGGGIRYFALPFDAGGFPAYVHAMTRIRIRF